MMKAYYAHILCGASVAALSIGACGSAEAQTASPPAQATGNVTADQAAQGAAQGTASDQDIVVTGVRESLR
ncbi:hypothetical protein [Sphingomonas zeae]